MAVNSQQAAEQAFSAMEHELFRRQLQTIEFPKVQGLGDLGVALGFKPPTLQPAQVIPPSPPVLRSERALPNKVSSVSPDDAAGVKDIQKKLNKVGYSVPETGAWEESTASALVDFARKHNIRGGNFADGEGNISAEVVSVLKTESSKQTWGVVSGVVSAVTSLTASKERSGGRKRGTAEPAEEGTPGWVLPVAVVGVVVVLGGLGLFLVTRK